MKKMTSFDKAEEEITWEIGGDIAPKYLGDDAILLLGLTDNRAEDLANEENTHRTTLFYALEKWNPGIRMGYRLVWLLCWGIPLAAWDMEHIRKVVAAIRDLVEVDDDVEELRRLDRARVLVRTSWKPILHHKVNLHIGDEVFPVEIVEEMTNDTRRLPSSRQHWILRRRDYFL